MRLFIAIELSENTKEEINKQINSLRNKLAEYVSGKLVWVKPEDYHLTLKFLGEIDLNQYQDLVKLISNITKPTQYFKIKINKLTIWPTKVPKIIKANITKNNKLNNLTKKLSNQIDNNKFVSKDLLGYKPAHITIARIRQGVLTKKFTEIKLDLEFKATEIKLFQSELAPTGPSYTELETFKLK